MSYLSSARRRNGVTRLTKQYVHELAMAKHGNVVLYRPPGKLWRLVEVSGKLLFEGKNLRELCKNAKLRI